MGSRYPAAAQESLKVSISCGFPEEWSTFASRHPAFGPTRPKLERLFEKLLSRPKLQSDADKAIFFLGLMAVQSFNEIVLLAANSYGTGAQKILRTLYEQTVTALYVHKEPQEAERFLSYQHYTAYKIFQRSKDFYGPGHTDNYSEERRAALERDWGRVAHLYPEKPRSWSKLHLLSMAEKTKTDALVRLYSPCVDEPNMEIHASSAAILSRLEEAASGELLVRAEGQATADKAFNLAVVLLPLVLDALSTQFRRSLDTEIADTFQALWRTAQPPTAPEPSTT